MSWKRSVWVWVGLVALVVVASAGLLATGCAGSGAHANAPPTSSPPQPISLVESWPIGTDLDNPDIPDAKDVWLEMVAGAQTSMDFAFFYGTYQEGSALAKVLEAIEAKAAAGVRVRFVFDEKFYAKNKEIPDRLKTKPGVEVRILDGSKNMGGVLHAKYFVIDNRDAFLGSQNFDWRSLEHIQELGLRITEPTTVAVLADTFALDWALAGSEPADAEAVQSLKGQKSYGFPVSIAYGDQTVRASAIVSPRDWITDPLSWDLPPLLDAINSAKTRVRVQLLSYHVESYDKSRFEDLDNALRAAAARGVKVEMMVADWSKKPSSVQVLKDLQGQTNITIKLVTIPPWDGGFIPFARVIHAKYMTVDGRVGWVGTSNWSGDYFLKSRNVGVIVEGGAFAASLDRFFDRLWSSPLAETVDPAKTYEEPLYKDQPSP